MNIRNLIYNRVDPGNNSYFTAELVRDGRTSFIAGLMSDPRLEDPELALAVGVHFSIGDYLNASCVKHLSVYSKKWEYKLTGNRSGKYGNGHPTDSISDDELYSIARLVFREATAT